MASPQTSVLSLQGVVLAGRRAAHAPTALDFELGHREVALVEVDEDGDAAGFVDLCLGLTLPRDGEVWCLGQSWQRQAYREMLAHRSRIGSLVESQVWPAHLPVAQVTVTPWLYHTDQPIDDAVVAATALARRFGLPGLPTESPEAVHRDDLVRAACVRAFLGAPEFVLIADPALEAIGTLAVPLAQAIGDVRDRGGAVLWLVGSLRAAAVRHVQADHALHLGDRGLSPARRLQ